MSRISTTSTHLTNYHVSAYPGELQLPNLPSTPNQHVSVDADGKVHVDLTFVEEPLGLRAQDGYGWPQLEFSETIGPNNQYVIARKLGWGMQSSTWLARDTRENSYVAVKILNGRNTDLVRQGRIWELGALELVSSPPSSHCLRLLSHFTIPGKGSAGEHMCFVTPVLGGDVKSLHEKYPPVLPLPLAKRILLHTLRGIAHAHRCGIVHTDLKHDNIFFDTRTSNEDFDVLLASDPSRRHPPEGSYDGIVQAAVSQPLPIPSIEEALRRTYVLADLGSARPITNYLADEITSYPLRPPEIIIGGPWNEKGTFGCLVFELVTGRGFFKYETYPKYNLDEPSYHLYTMLCYTGQDFSAEQLTASAWADKYFDSTCNLKADPPLINWPFERSIRSYKVMDELDVLSTATLMRRCLRLDPADRASAADLLSDPWFAGVD